MVSILTMVLTVTTCQTWEGKCEKPEVTNWTYEVVDLTRQGLVEEIRACYGIGYERAHDVYDAKRHVSSNVKCEWELIKNAT